MTYTPCAFSILYIVEVQNGCFDFIPRFSIFLRKREFCASVLKEWTAKTLLMNKFRLFASLHEGRILPAALTSRLTTEITKFATPFTSD